MNRCLSTLADLDNEGFTSAALGRLSDRRVFPTRLEFSRDDIPEIQAKTVDRMSISGIQDKLSLRLASSSTMP